MDSLSQNSRIEELYSSFKEARERITRIKKELKCYNDIDNDIQIPSINEIRYVVYHTLKGLNEDEPKRQDEEFRRAIRHCQRASYDILEIGITDKIEYVKNFSYKYRNINIAEIIEEWPEFQKKVNEINISLAEINRSEYSNIDYQNLAEKKYQEICDLVVILDNSVEELYKKIKERRWAIFKLTSSVLFTFASLTLLAKKFVTTYSIDLAAQYHKLFAWLKNILIQ